MGLIDLFVPEVNHAKKALDDAQQKAEKKAAINGDARSLEVIAKLKQNLGQFKAESEQRARNVAKKTLGTAVNILTGGTVDISSMLTPPPPAAPPLQFGFLPGEQDLQNPKGSATSSGGFDGKPIGIAALFILGWVLLKKVFK